MRTIVGVLLALACAPSVLALDQTIKPIDRSDLAGKLATKPKVVAAPAPAPGAITRIRIVTKTGDDDLRRNSSVSAFLILQDGRRIESKPLNYRKSSRTGEEYFQGIRPRTNEEWEWTLDPAVVVRAADIRRFGLTFKSGKNGPFDTGDNWDLSSLDVEYVVATADPSKGIAAGTSSLLTLKNRGGVYRFKTDESWESEPLGR